MVQLRPKGQVLTAAEIRAAITKSTRAVCLTWVHSFSGQSIDLDEIGAVCREVDALFVVNGSQAVGAIPISVQSHPIDVLTTVGFKWLCGPYGTGFCWLGPRAYERIAATKLYWLTALSTEDLTKPELDLNAIKPAKTGRHDIFGTANFFNYAALVESAGLVAEVGVQDIHRHNLELADHLVNGLDSNRYEVQKRGVTGSMTSIVFVRPLTSTVSEVSETLRSEAIDVAERSGMIRFSPHFYNTPTDIERALAAMN